MSWSDSFLHGAQGTARPTFLLVCRPLGLALWLLLAGIVGWYGWMAYANRTEAGWQTAPGPESVDPAPVAFDAMSWDLLRGQSGAAVAVDPSTDRYRLAGTFFVQSEDPDLAPARSAILDDVRENQQYLVREGDRVADLDITRIYADRIIARRDGRDLEIRLGFTEPVARSQPGGDAVTDAAEGVILSESAYGQQISESRWIMSRDALMGYYRDVLNEPERVASLYMSMKGVRDDEGEPAGFRLEPAGENDFFAAVGLKEGDVIRRVNSMNMTSQPRAEYFLSEFVQDRLSAVVIDVDRDGETAQLIYLLR